MRLFRRKTQHIGFQELSDLIDDRIAGRRKEQVQAHVASCDPCREELEGLQYTVGLLQQAPMLAPRRRLAVQEAEAPVAARPLVASWAYGAAASVAVLLAVVLGADLMGALPGAGDDFGAEQSAFSDDQLESEVAFFAEEVESEAAGVQSEALMETEVSPMTLSDEAIESGPSDEARVARSDAEVTVEPDGDEGTHVLWRVLEGALAVTLALLLGVVLWRMRRSLRSAR